MTWDYGDGHPIRGLAEQLGRDQPAWCLGLDPEQEAKGVMYIEDCVDWFFHLIDRMEIKPPYRIAAWSFGGVVALELARKLKDDGRDVDWLGLLDTELPDRVGWFVPFMAREVVVAYDTMSQSGARLSHLAFHTRAFWGRRIRRVGRHVRGRYERWRRGMSEEETARQAFRALVLPAWRRYRAKPFDGWVELFITAEYTARCKGDRSLGWSPYFRGGYRTRRVPGEHLKMLEEPSLAVIADIVRSTIDGLPSRSGGQTAASS
jgi:thioesterase domain-containing protein